MLTELLQTQFLIKMQSKTVIENTNIPKSNYLSMWADSEFWLDEQISKQL